ncbi:Phosphatidate cytidylyltransferase [Oligella ureolytica]|uniref:Phosphatidate cytidylyltransferase n=1 Tax=Oligella ureolytica TaxID=90244 RepID=A0A378XC35_9BURK|nr:CDP-archaeol synthase [Oligella ureolytica]QPT40188.1 CDP-archaeol synthase [Oligella ureolytica]SUA50362.1 Phosphatidate cytidylyltransferase [Oligella ureolytica]
MLRERLMTAVVLLVILAVLLSLQQSVYFAIFCVIASGLTLAEWWRVCLDGRFKRLAFGVATILTIVVIIFSFSLVTRGDEGMASTQLTDTSLVRFNLWLSIISSAIWLFVIPFILKKGQTQHKENPLFHGLFALIAVSAAALSLILFVQYLGSWFVFSYFILIWCADTFAYFGGRHFGGTKLAPAISPGKTRSGAICGVLAATLWLVISAYMSPTSFGGILLAHSNLLVLLLSAIVLSIYSIVGDLYESLMKRRANIKDSSNILPGHGGVWDRLDSALVVTPMTFLLIYVFLI